MNLKKLFVAASLSICAFASYANASEVVEMTCISTGTLEDGKTPGVVANVVYDGGTHLTVDATTQDDRQTYTHAYIRQGKPGDYTFREVGNKSGYSAVMAFVPGKKGEIRARTSFKAPDGSTGHIDFVCITGQNS